MAKKKVGSLSHEHASRKNIPSAELASAVGPEVREPRPVTYERNRDLDPQLVWRGKDEQNTADLVVQAPPLFIQERVHPNVLIDDLLRMSEASDSEMGGGGQPSGRAIC